MDSLTKAYEDIDLYNDSIEKLAHEKFDPKIWMKQYNKLKEERNFHAIKALRIVVQEGTIKVCEKGQYRTGNGTVVSLGDPLAIEQAIARNHTVKQIPVNHFPKKYENTVIEVKEGDCLEVALDMKLNQGLNPVVLNMASMKRPGGGYRNGAGAQEENLFRRSNYYQHLEHPNQFDFYPLPEFGGIYSPDVLVFRSSEDTGYAFLDKPVPLSFVAVAAYTRPGLVNSKYSKEPLLQDKFADKTKNKIRTMLNIALHHEHDSIVLSAFGCGAYANPPRHMARLFSQVLSEYNGSFKCVTFAIYDDANAHKAHNPDGNFLPFYEVFHGSVKNKDSNSKGGNRTSSSKDSKDANNNKGSAFSNANSSKQEKSNENNNNNSTKSNNNNSNNLNSNKKRGNNHKENPPGWD